MKEEIVRQVRDVGCVLTLKRYWMIDRWIYYTTVSPDFGQKIYRP